MKTHTKRLMFHYQLFYSVQLAFLVQGSNFGHILIYGVESWSGVEPWSGVGFLEWVFWSRNVCHLRSDDYLKTTQGPYLSKIIIQFQNDGKLTS